MKAKKLICKNIPIVTLDDKAYNVLNMMDAFGVSHLSIVDHNLFVGVISEEELYTGSNMDNPISMFNYIKGDCFVYEGQHIYDVMYVLSKNRFTLVPVISVEHFYKGSIVVCDLLQEISKLLSVDVNGTIVVLEFNDIDFSLSELTQIVEYNHSRILNLYIQKIPESREILVTLKIESDNIVSVLESFNRYEYIVKDVFSYEETDFDVYNDRLENLMNFLKY